MGSSAQTYRWATVTQEQAEARDPEEWKTRRKIEEVIRWNQWILLLPHAKGMTLTWIIDEHVPRNEAIAKRLGQTGIRVWVDKQEHVAFVRSFVPSHLGGVPVVVEANPVDFRLEALR